MSSLANHHNQSNSASITESDNDIENEFDSSCNRQNESMMHKVKDVVSKFLHPSFLFSTNDDTDRSKRKRSSSVEERQTTTITTDSTNGHTATSRSRYGRSTIQDDEPQITDDEDSNSRDVASTERDTSEIEQQKKRRRTANYQHILSTKPTNAYDDDDERISSPLTTTDSFRSVSNRRTDHSSSIAPMPDERINRFTPVKQRFDILPTYRGSTSSYDPTKSPLFSAGNRVKTTAATTTATTTATNLKSNEFSANYLLASGLVSRPQPSSSHGQQSPATLTNPSNTTRQMFGVNYSSINSRRLPYIERLRRRTLQDCIRLNRTLDSEPLSESVIEEHRSATASPVTKRIKAPEKDCATQCDISTVESSIEPNKKIQRTFPPADIRNEALTIPTVVTSQSSSQTDAPIQTNSSITIERIAPKFDITKPKVLGNVTPFSWPKFARAQEEYAKKHPEKCRTDTVPATSVSSFKSGGSNTNITPTVSQQRSASPVSKIPMLPFSASRPAADVWKCPSCTKEHPAQTASCSLCRQINPNYKKLSAMEPTLTARKEPVSSNKLPDVITKEPSAPTPITNQAVPTTTKESVFFTPPSVTTSAAFSTVPFTSSSSLPVTTKETSTSITAPVSTIAPFGTTPIVSSTSTTKESLTSITAPVTSNPLFGTSPIVSPILTVKESPITTNTASSTPSLNTTPTVSPLATSANSFSPSITRPSFGVTSTITTTTENPVSTSIPSIFGTTATLDKTSTGSPFPSAATFPPFIPISTASPSTTVTTSAAPSVVTVSPSIPTSISFGVSGSTSFISPPSTITAATAPAPAPATVSFTQPPAFTFGSSTFTSSLPTNTSAPSNLFGSSSVIPTPATTTSASSFPTPSTTSAFNNPIGFTFMSPTTTATTTPTPFGGSGFGLSSTSTTNNPSPFGFGAGSPPRLSSLAGVTSTNSSTTPAFGTIPSFGAGPSFGTNTPFGIPSSSTDKTASAIPSSLSFGTSNAPSSLLFGPQLSAIATSASSFPSGGFTFTPSTTVAPAFGVNPTPLSSGASLNPFGSIGGTTAIPPVANNLFQFSAPAPAPTSTISNQFAGDLSASSEPINPFDVTRSESPSGRRMLKAIRRKP